MTLDYIEIQLLTELREPHHAGWLTPGELAEAYELPPWKVRAILSDLRKRHLVQRGSAALGHWGEFSITERGMIELAASTQLRLVRNIR